MRLRHHPDDLIYLNDVCYPLNWFLTQEPGYNLPKGAIGREYIQNSRHILFSGNDQWSGEIPWQDGDLYLSKVSTYAAVWTTDYPPEPVPIPPNWSSFRAGMLNDSGYQRITLLATADNNGRLAVQRVETAMSMPDPNLEVIEALWEQVITSLPLLNKPTAMEIGRFNTIATANHIPFMFKSDGKIQL